MTAARPRRGKGPPLRLRTRLALATASLVTGAVALTAWFTLSRVERTFEMQFAERVDRLLHAAESRYQARGARLDGRLRALAQEILRDRSLAERLLLRPEPTSPPVLEAAGRLQRVAGLDLLEIVADDGVVLSSGHWFERAGLPGKDPAAVPEGTPVLRRERLPEGEVLAWVARRPVSLGGHRVHLVGGAVLGTALLEEIAPGRGEAVVLVDGSSGGVATAGEGARLAPRGEPLSPELLSTAPGRRRLRGPDGALWEAGDIALLGPDGSWLGSLVVAVDRAGLAALQGRLRATFLGVGVAGALLAIIAAAWLADRFTRPVAGLLRAVEAVGAGREDYSFPAAGQDEIGALVTAFSRMQRSLQAQRDRLLAAERVAAWREVARRVAHEVKNPLSPIRLTVENLVKARRQAPEMFDEIFRDGTRSILEEVEQLSRIVSEFSEFARLPPPRPRQADLDALLDSVLSLYAGEPGLQVVRERTGALPAMRLDPDQISRALKNLLGNAVEAMRPGGGVLRASTWADGDVALVQIDDSGPGLAGDAARRLFEPYFTTKEKGTGLGLPIALRIVSDHGGSIAAANRPEGGVRIVVRLPVAAPGVEEAEGEA